MIIDFKIRTRGGQGALLSVALSDNGNLQTQQLQALYVGMLGAQVGHRPDRVSPWGQDKPEQWVEAGAKLGFSSAVAGKTDPRARGLGEPPWVLR